jgi:hypothetical protein
VFYILNKQDFYFVIIGHGQIEACKLIHIWQLKIRDTVKYLVSSVASNPRNAVVLDLVQATTEGRNSTVSWQVGDGGQVSDIALEAWNSVIVVIALVISLVVSFKKAAERPNLPYIGEGGTFYTAWNMRPICLHACILIYMTFFGHNVFFIILSIWGEIKKYWSI